MSPRAVRRGLTLPIALLGLWWLAAERHWAPPHLLVAPAKVLAELRRLLGAGELWTSLGASLGRNLAGLLLGGLVGVAGGLALGGSARLGRLLGPSLNGLKQVAVFAWIPLLSLWFGHGDGAKVAFVAASAFFPALIGTWEGTRAVAVEHVEVARVLRFSRWQLLRRVVLPSAAPAIFSGLQLSLTCSWLATIGAEYFLGAGPGIGRLMIEGREQFRMDRVLLGVLITGGVGWLLATLASQLEAHLIRWRRAPG